MGYWLCLPCHSGAVAKTVTARELGWGVVGGNALVDTMSQAFESFGGSNNYEECGVQ